MGFWFDPDYDTGTMDYWQHSRDYSDSDLFESYDRPNQYGGGQYYERRSWEDYQGTQNQTGQSNYWDVGSPGFGSTTLGGEQQGEEQPRRGGIRTVASRPRYGPITGQTTVSRAIAPDRPMPSYERGIFDAPEWDEERIGKLTQKHMAAGVRKLRQGLGRALVTLRQEENPNVKREMLRKMSEGYGTGLSDVAEKARRTALSEYGKEYQTEYNEAVINFEAAEQARMQNFNAAMQAYINEYIRVSSTQYQRQDYGAGMDGGSRRYSWMRTGGNYGGGYNQSLDALTTNLFRDAAFNSGGNVTGTNTFPW